MKMLTGSDMDDWMGKRAESVCENTEKRIFHYLCKKITYQPEFKMPNLYKKHSIQLVI
jgi:hypothetical protein